MSAPDRARELSTDHLLSDIGGRSVRGGAITFAAQWFKVVLQFGTVVVLARLLSPTAFGLIAMATALNTVLDGAKELGLSSATIRKPEITHEQVTALFWINTAVGALFTLMLCLAAPAIARFYHQPQLIPVTRCLAFGFLLSGLTVQHWALLRRQMRFTVTAAIDTGGEACGFIVAIAVALAGGGYWALVAQRLLSLSIGFIASWTACRWRPGLPRRTEGIGELFGFGASVTVSSVAGSISRSVDQILVGWLWGANALGLYERAAKLLIAPLNNINIPLWSVAMPALSRLAAQKERYRLAFGEMMEKLAMVTMPGAAFIAATADWVVDILFGPRWHAATPLVALFAIAIAYQPMVQGASLLYLTQNRPRALLHWSLIDMVLYIVAICAGLPFGTVGVAAALALGGLTLRLPIAFWLGTRSGPVSLADLIASLLPASAAALAVAGAVIGVRHFILPTAGASAASIALVLAAAAIAAGLAYLAIPRSRRALFDLARLWRQLRRRRSTLAV